MLVGNEHVNKKDASSPCWVSEMTQWIKAFAINPDPGPTGEENHSCQVSSDLSMCTYVHTYTGKKKCRRKTASRDKTLEHTKIKN